MNSFNNASGFVVHNLNQTEYRTSDVNGFKLLQDHVVKGASHNAGERFDAPKCHPETRTAVLSSIKSWVDSNDKERIMWLHGPAGAGKSTIAQTTAVDCDNEGKLAASFFFSRLAGRNKKDGLIATIAYQLSVSIPLIREHIIKNIERNPKIFEADIKTQIQWLVVDPLSHVDDSSVGVIPRLVIIDGLDECEIRKDQAEIIESVSTSLSSVDSTSGLRVLIVSRPELEIRRTFKKDDVSSLCTKVVLDESFHPDKDIELYLRSHFQTIKRQHELGLLLPPSWPPEDSIQILVAKSSGQFIYASTVIHFVSDPEHDPRKRLDTILEIRPAGNDDNPYSQLDALYSAILSTCNYAKVSAIFETIMFTKSKAILQRIEHLETFLSLKDEIMLLLANLHSIIDVNNISRHGIRFYHASLFDYLVDSSRSREFHINRREGHVHLSMKCLHHLMNLRLSENNRVDDRVVKHCLKSCFFHFNRSGWDDRILDFIYKNNMLKPDNSQLEDILSFYIGDDSCILRRLLQYVEYDQDDQGDRGEINESLRAIINDEIRNHLEQYPRKDIIYIYSCRKISQDSVAYQLHTNFMETSSIRVLSIMRSDIFLYGDVREWLFERFHITEYIQKIPGDIPAKSICCILDLAAEERGKDLLNDIISLLHKIIDQDLPLSKNTSSALSEKWNVVGNVLRGLYDDEEVNEIEQIIKSYCERVENDARKDVLSVNDCKRVEIDARKDVLPANDREDVLSTNDNKHVENDGRNNVLPGNDSTNVLPAIRHKTPSGFKGLLSDLKRKIFRTRKH